MSQVYVVVRDMGWDGDEVIGVYSTLEQADAIALSERLLDGDSPDTYRVDAYIIDKVPDPRPVPLWELSAEGIKKIETP
jgi:hypothetical protein